MESNSLEQLLACPVCFERLDGSNRVLPCQHTFCKKCLERVKTTFKELRCPECRTKYSGSINDLHCNILVMRILEQIKQAEKETSKAKNTSNNHAKQSNNKTKINVKPSMLNDERRNFANSGGNSSTVTTQGIVDTNSCIHRASSNRAEVGVTAQQAPNSNENLPSCSRVILGAIRKQNRNSSIFAGRPIPSSSSNTETVSHSVRENVDSTFSPSSYTFTVELKSSDRNSSSNRRANKNYVKPSILNAVSNTNGIITSRNIFDNFTVAHSNVVTPSTSQPISLYHNGSKNYLSFSPGSYTFNVNLKSTDRVIHKKKNYLS